MEGNGDGTVEIAYDLAGRRKRTASSGKVLQRYQYDAMGNLTGLTDGNGNETAYATDLWGRVKPLPLQTAQWSITAMTMREMYAQQQTETETR